MSVGINLEILDGIVKNEGRENNFLIPAFYKNHMILKWVVLGSFSSSSIWQFV